MIVRLMLYCADKAALLHPMYSQLLDMGSSELIRNFVLHFCLFWAPAGARAMGGLYPGPTDLSWGDSIDRLKWIMSRAVFLGYPQLPILTISQVVCHMLKLWCHIPGL